MALPGESLSTNPMPSQFVGGRSLAVSSRQDYETGGIALQDPSQGLRVQTWRARLIGQAVVIDADTVAPVTWYSAPGITEISLSFDQNMRPVLAFVQDGVAKLRWFDPVAGAVVVTNIGAGVVTPRVALDDKRRFGVPDSDVLLAYLRGGALYYRQQRERFLTERLLHAGPHYRLIKIGMGRGLRMQFDLERPE